MSGLDPTRANRCTAKSRQTKTRCNNTAMTGLAVCRMHGGKTPRAAAKSELVKAEQKILGMRRYTTPIPHDDWEAAPVNAFEMEFRRTIAHIRYYEEKLAELKEEALIWGRTKQEDEFGEEGYLGKKQTDEAKPHLYEELLFRERRHLAELIKSWIAAGLGAKRLQLEQDAMDRLELALSNIIVALGRDPRDPEVRQIVRNELLKASGTDGLSSPKMKPDPAA